MSHEEIEVKFIIDDLPTLRQRVVALGARLKTPRTYEDNLTFDTPDEYLKRQGRLLRLRRDQRNLLTYKEPSAIDDQDFKVRHEYEVEVSAFDPLHTILGKLGFVPALRYEKYRETFVYQEAEILLDETPLGAFMEIEGSRDVIRTIVADLQLDFGEHLTSSYGDIFDAVRITYQLQLTDLTFENFQALDINLRACRLT